MSWRLKQTRRRRKISGRPRAAPFRSTRNSRRAATAEVQLRSELEAVRARLEEGDDELAKRDDQCVQLAQEPDDARAEGEGHDAAEQTRLALAVAEEERDARVAEERRLMNWRELWKNETTAWTATSADGAAEPCEV